MVVLWEYSWIYFPVLQQYVSSVIQFSHSKENIWNHALRIQVRPADSSTGTFGKIILNCWGRVAYLCTVCCNEKRSFQFIYVFHVYLISKWLFHYVVSIHCFLIMDTECVFCAVHRLILYYATSTSWCFHSNISFFFPNQFFFSGLLESYSSLMKTLYYKS